MRHPFLDAFIPLAGDAAADDISEAVEQYTALTIQSATEITTRALDRTRVVHLDTGGLYRVYIYDPDNTDDEDGVNVILDSEDRPFVLRATLTATGGFDDYDTTANQGNYDGKVEGFRLFLTDALAGDGGWVVRDDDGPGGWFGPFPYRGPSGPPGASFAPDAVVAALAGRDAYDDAATSFSVLVESDASNGDLPTLYFKLSAASADWSAGSTFGAGATALDYGLITGAVGNANDYGGIA